MAVCIVLLYPSMSVLTVTFVVLPQHDCAHCDSRCSNTSLCFLYNTRYLGDEYIYIVFSVF